MPLTLAEALAAGPVLGTWVKLPTVESVELMALGGFDVVVLDLEHSPMSLETAATLIAVGRGVGLVTLVRTPDHAQSWIQRCLDAGAAGVIVPHVDDVEQATRVIRSARFEPEGTRGVGPTSRAGAWGLTPLGDYLGAGPDAAVLVQLESPVSVEAAERIAAVPSLTGLFVGPADLSVAMGVPAGDPSVSAAVARVRDVAHAAGLPCGTATGSAALARDLLDQGFDLVMVGNDATLLGTAARDLVSAVRATF